MIEKLLDLFELLFGYKTKRILACAKINMLSTEFIETRLFGKFINVSASNTHGTLIKYKKDLLNLIWRDDSNFSDYPLLLVYKTAESDEGEAVIVLMSLNLQVMYIATDSCVRKLLTNWNEEHFRQDKTFEDRMQVVKKHIIENIDRYLAE